MRYTNIMVRKQSKSNLTLSLDSLRIQINTFNKRKHVTTHSDTIERDAIKFALIELDPYIEDCDANLHANIIIKQKLCSPYVSEANIQDAVKLQNNQIRNMFKPVKFEAKFI